MFFFQTTLLSGFIDVAHCIHNQTVIFFLIEKTMFVGFIDATGHVGCLSVFVQKPVRWFYSRHKPYNTQNYFLSEKSMIVSFPKIRISKQTCGI